MAITASILSPGNQGRGPVPQGSLGFEDWELTGDGASTVIAVTARRLRRATYALGTEATVTFSGKIATLVFGSPIASSAKKVVRIIGLGR